MAVRAEQIQPTPKALVAGGEAVLEVIAGPSAKLGMVLLDMKRAAQELTRLV